VKLGPIEGTAEPGIGWFRVFGYGLHWKDTRRHHVFFSERNGYMRVLRLGPWSLKWLVPVLVACFTITDPDQRALCRATESRQVGQCTFIEDPALRQQCRARVSGRPSPCNTVTDAWEREKCRREARP
jgi:hypothetical protein